MNIRRVCCQLLLVVMASGATAQRHYICYFTTKPPVIDGSGDDVAWKSAPWTEDFTDIQGNARPRPALRTRAKMLWDTANLFIYAELQEPDLWGTLRQHDTLIYEDNDFEIFVNPDNTTHRYFEIEINALGTVMDLFMDKPYRNGGKALMSWDTQGMRSAIALNGTLNHPGDKDQDWRVELAIPLNSLRFFDDKPVADATQWRINFSRVEWDREVSGGRYRVKRDPFTGRRNPEHNWVWSPQGIVDMHVPEKWAYLQFSTHAGGADTTGFAAPADVRARDWLWDLYKAQLRFQKARGRYANSLQELGMMAAPGGMKAELKATDWQYMCILSAGSFGKLSISQDGEVR